MSEDALFDLVNEAVMYAKEQIEKEEILDLYSCFLQFLWHFLRKFLNRQSSSL